MNIWLGIAIITGAILAILLLPLLRSKQWKTSALLALIITAGSLGTYHFLGQPQIAAELALREQHQEEFQQTIDKLSAELKNKPNNLKLWSQLGALYIETGNFAAAAEAFRHTVLLSNGNPEMIFRYAKALTLASGGAVTPDAQKGFEMVLKLVPQHREAAFFLGLQRLQAGDKTAARERFEILLKQLPPEAPMAEMLRQMLEKL